MRYQGFDRSDRNRGVTADLGYQMTRRLGWNLSYTRFERRSQAIGQTANQNVIYFQVILRR